LLLLDQAKRRKLCDHCKKIFIFVLSSRLKEAAVGSSLRYPTQRYLYNGKELNKDFGLNWYDYGARWYDAGVGRFHGIDRFASKYAFQSDYVYATDNPIRFVEVNGDSVVVDLSNTDSQKAFQAFFSTKAGRLFISMFAAKGQKINGYTFKSSGIFHKLGIDLFYRDRDFGEMRKETGGETKASISDNRLKLEVWLNTNSNHNSLLDKVEALTHESWLHSWEYSKDYKDNGKLDFSHDPFYEKLLNNSPSKRHHKMFHYNPGAAQNHPFAVRGMSVLEEVNRDYDLGYTRKELWERLWNFWD